MSLRATHRWIFLLLWLFGLSPLWAQQEVAIGVLAKRGAEPTVTRWQPTADYLSDRLKAYRFIIVPVDFERIYDAVAHHDIDFVLANPAIYVELDVRYGASRIVTLLNRGPQGQGYSRFGGTLFTRTERGDIGGLEDLRGRRFAAVKENSFGGYLTALRELVHHDIYPERDFASLSFEGTHDAVVYSVLQGRNDAGTVRTDTLERMAAEGKIDLADIRVLNPHTYPDFDYWISTDLYPEWPLARVKGTPAALSDSVAAALLTMPHDHPAAIASDSDGWSVPGNYQPVRELMQELRVGPYEILDPIRFGDLAAQYGGWLAVITLLLLLLAVANAYVARLNHRLRRTDAALREARDTLADKVEARTAELRESHRRLELIHRDWNDAFDAITHPIFIHDATLRVVHANPAYVARSGLTLEQIEGRYYWEIYPRLAQPLETCEQFPERSPQGGEELKLDDGTILISHSFAIKRPDGSLGHAIHILEDVTRTRQAEARQRTLIRALEQASEVVLIIDAKGGILFANQTAAVMLHRKPEGLTGLDLGALMSEMRLPMAQEALLELAGGNSGWQGEITLRGEEHEVPCHLTLSTIRDDLGALQGYVATLLDLSEIKRAEATLRYRIGIESLLGTLAARFLGTDGTALDTAIVESLQEIGRFVDVDRVYLIDIDPQSEQIGERYLWSRSAQAQPPAPAFDPTQCQWLSERLRRRETVPVADVAELPPEADAVCTLLRDRRTQATLIMPIFRGSRFAGLIGLECSGQRREWSQEEQRLLRISSEIIANAISRHEAESRVRQSRKSLNEAQRIAQLGNWDWDIVNNNLRWSDETYRIFSIDPQAFGATCEAFLSYVHEEDRQRVIDAVNTSIEQHTEYAVDHRVVWPDGSVRTVHEMGKVDYAKDGSPLRMLGTVQDVTDLRRRQEELARLNRTLHTLSQGNSVLVHSHDELSLLRSICRVLVETGGHLYACVIHEADGDLSPVVCHGGTLEPIASLLGGSDRDTPLHRVLTGENHLIERDFDHRTAPWYAHASALGFDSLVAMRLCAQGQVIGLLAIFSDRADAFDEAEVSLLQELADDLAYGIRALRERATAEAAQSALEESEHRYHNLFDTAPSGFVSVSASDDTILQCNPAFARIVGREFESLKGTPLLTLYADGPMGKGRAREILQRFKQGKPVRDEEVQMARPDGTPVWVSLTVEPVLDEAGRVQESRSSIIDISERKAAEAERKEFIERTERSLLQTIQAIALTIEKRDPYTAGHQQRTAELATAIARRMGMDEEFIKGLRLGAMIHDIGKICVPTEILNHPRKLDEVQFMLIRSHPQVGYDIIKGIEFPWPLAQMVLQHHERLDGSGYPYGIQGDEIRLEARILAVADVVEAMASHRPYRSAMTLEDAIREITGGRGKLYDSEVVDACLQLLTNRAFDWLASNKAMPDKASG
jgi:PAS domain S-box-containing protein/putative nucleotidyltransferase with HDIG domain